MADRDGVCKAAATRIGSYGKGSPEVEAMWRRVLPLSWTDAQVRQYAKTKEWCGGFALDCLRESGITDAHWQDGVGFLGPLRLPRVPWPKMGDIAVKDHPFAHHMVVEYWNRDNDWGDIAGNTPFAARHHHGSSVGISFYSIEPLLSAADTEPPTTHHPTLRLGATDTAAVRDLQERLNRYMDAGLELDGEFGPKTMRALQVFQRDRGLDADGVAGSATWKELDRA